MNVMHIIAHGTYNVGCVVLFHLFSNDFNAMLCTNRLIKALYTKKFIIQKT